MKCSVLFGAENIFTRKRNVYVESQNGKSHCRQRKIDRRNVEIFIVEDILLKKNIEKYI